MSRILVKYEFYGTLRQILAEDESEARILVNDLTDKAKRPCAWFAITGKDKETGRFIWEPQGKNRFVSEDLYDFFGLPYDDIPDDADHAGPVVANDIQVVYMAKTGEKKIESFSVRAEADVMYSVCVRRGIPVYMTINGVLELKANCG